MASLPLVLKSHRVLAYFTLAYALTWLLTPLILISPMLGLPGLLMPALSAILVTSMTEGREGVQSLLGRLLIWRVNIIWYVVVLGLPVLISIAISYLGVLLGTPNQVQFSPISPLSLVVFILVVGEEVGWRGYALPKLLEVQSPLRASLILGVLWGGWHLPTFFIPGLPQTNIPFVAYLIYTTALAILFTWLYQHTRGSLLLATLFHGAIDTFGFNNPAVDPALRWWLTAAVCAAVALVVLLIYGPGLKRGEVRE